MSRCQESFLTPKGRGRVESVQEMGETTETVLGMCTGIQVHSSFHTEDHEGHEKLGTNAGP